MSALYGELFEPRDARIEVLKEGKTRKVLRDLVEFRLAADVTGNLGNGGRGNESRSGRLCAQSGRPLLEFAWRGQARSVRAFKFKAPKVSEVLPEQRRVRKSLMKDQRRNC